MIKENLRKHWKSEIKKVMDQYVDRTPGSFIEEKIMGWSGITVG